MIHRRMQSKAKAKDPYSQYDKLASEGVTISWGNPADEASLPDGPFDIVYDNNGKALDVCKPAIDKYKVPACTRPSSFVGPCRSTHSIASQPTSDSRVPTCRRAR